MALHRLTSTDGFVVFDLDGPDATGPDGSPLRAVGLVRAAPKVLRDGAELLARSVTYAAAAFGLTARGASAGLNAAPEDRGAALEAFVAEVAPMVEDGRWLPGAGTGVEIGALDALGRADERTRAFDAQRSAAGALAAAAALAPGEAVAVHGTGPVADAARLASGAEASVPIDADVAVLAVAGRAGLIDHEAAAGVRARVVVPLTPVPVTARALAVLARAGTVVVPDFVSTAAPLVDVLDPTAGDGVERVRALAADLAGAGTGAWMVAVERAEAHLGTWRSELPFGRPLA